MIKYVQNNDHDKYNFPHFPIYYIQVNVAEASDPRKVKVSGPAIESDCIKTFEPTYLLVDCSNAGPGLTSKLM